MMADCSGADMRANEPTNKKTNQPTDMQVSQPTNQQANKPNNKPTHTQVNPQQADRRDNKHAS